MNKLEALSKIREVVEEIDDEELDEAIMIIDNLVELNETLVSSDGCCSNCGNDFKIGDITYHTEYCWKCGQKMDWNEKVVD